jgi:hypothetical protein
MKRILAVSLTALIIAALVGPAALAAEEKTVLAYSVKDARAFLWQIHYPQGTFISEKYGPCRAKEAPPTAGVIPNPADKYECDRTRYNQEPNSCGKQALGRITEAPETPQPDEVEDGVGPEDVGADPADFPVGNVVTVVHGLALGRLGSSAESGGLASMYYVDNSGRRETEAHVESDGYVGNRNDYEERCAVVDAFSESSMYPGPFAAHMLSRSTTTPSTYNMAAFTTAEAASALPPGKSKESVSIVKLWEAGGKVHGMIASTVRALTLADQIKVDLVRSIISFSSDGTEKGLRAAAKTEALGVSIAGTKFPSLSANEVIPLGDNSYLGVASPMVQSVDKGRQLIVRAPGLFLAAHTTLDQLPIPEDPFTQEPFKSLPGAEDFKGELTLGGKLYPDQVVYVAGALLDTSMGRLPEFSLGPLPPLPNLPPFPSFKPPTFTPPTFGTAPVPPGAQPVGTTRYITRELAGSAWTLAIIVAFTLLGLLGVMGRWAMRFEWARRLSHVAPFPAFDWAYRAFLKG